MDFIERIFNLAPDDGSGSLEIVIVVALALMLVGLLVRARTRRNASHSQIEPKVRHTTSELYATRQTASLKGLAQQVDSAKTSEKQPTEKH